MLNAVVDNDFPTGGLLPKKETGVTTFLTKYPDYDGRGVTIAIFDSGVDPGAPGLQKTSEGKIKVVERFDCSGCGDVSTVTIVQPVDNCVTGLTERKLKIPLHWQNPSNNYRLGIKNAFDLYPERLKERILEERKDKLWNREHKLAMAEASRFLNKFDNDHASIQNLSEDKKLEREDLELRLEVLTNCEKKYVDAGPVYDCILFHDGKKWMACIDTSECGNLEECPLLSEYSVTHDYCVLTKSDQLNFSMNVHDSGNVLELVGLCSSHGTHVASIASAYFPESPEINGIAPGAQIVSLTIGDGRLGSMETGTALVRAMIKVMELQSTNPVHVINMSYGEHAHWSNAGRVGELMNEIVNKYGVVWIASAGNHGPALSTVGTPPDISQDNIIGVGAYVSPDMMVAEYSMRQKLTGMPYTWSSRGPSIDGGFGVTVCAPGGAITSVPNFTLRNSQLMNGTSMASPHVAGAVSLMLSGLKSSNLHYSPYSVKRALENCAIILDDVETFAQGRGLLQVDKTFEFLTTYHAVCERDVRFQVSCGPNNSKGLYLRSKVLNNDQEWSISVEPLFKDCDTVDANTKIKFNMKLALVCSESYVSHPSHLDLCNMARVFSIKVDTHSLVPGVHSASINAFDVNSVAKGPIFRVPITIMIPFDITKENYAYHVNSVKFKPNTIKRLFFVVPELATWAVIRLQTTDVGASGRFVLHCMQILPKQSCKGLEINKNIAISSNVECFTSFQVKGGLVLEVVVAKYWANLGEITINYTITFHGLKPSQPGIVMHGADGIHSLEISSLRGEEIQPNISLKTSVQILKPSESKVCPLSKRDILPIGRQIYELVITYNFHLSKATEVSPNCSLLSDVLYESEFESQLWMLFDSNKQLMGSGDAYPSKYSVKLEKGDYIVKLQIRHDKKEYLDKLIDIPMLLNQKLSGAVTLDIYTSPSQALIGGKKASVSHINPCSVIPLYIAPLASDKFVVKSNNAAHYLTGSVTYAKDELGKKVDSHPVKYILYDFNRKPTKVTDKDKTKYDEYKEAVRDLKTSWLSKMDVPSIAENLLHELCTEFSGYLPVHTSYLQSIEPMEPKNQLPLFSDQEISSQNNDDIQKILSLCDKILEDINQESMLAHFAIKNDHRSDAAKIRSSMERQRNVFLDCLCRKGIALCRLYQKQQINNDVSGSEQGSVSLESVCNVWRSLIKFADPYDTKQPTLAIPFFAMWHAAVHHHYGRVLKLLSKLQEEKSSRNIEEKYIELCGILKWNHIVHHLTNGLPSRYPPAYRPF